jgi:hypothetical protein
MSIKNPLHPGDFIRTEILAPAGLTVTAAAALQVSRAGAGCSAALHSALSRCISGGFTVAETPRHRCCGPGSSDG